MPLVRPQSFPPPRRNPDANASSSRRTPRPIPLRPIPAAAKARDPQIGIHSNIFALNGEGRPAVRYVRGGQPVRVVVIVIGFPVSSSDFKLESTTGQP